jgi:mycofactocin precursor
MPTAAEAMGGRRRDTRDPAQNHPIVVTTAHPARNEAGEDEEEPAACPPRLVQGGRHDSAGGNPLVPERPAVASEKPAEPGVGGHEALVGGDLLVEEVSIDGMCGVY